MSTSKKTFQLGFAIAASAALLVSGCAKPASEDVSMEAENSAAAPVAMVAHAKEEVAEAHELVGVWWGCLLYTSPSPRDQRGSRMPSSA